MDTLNFNCETIFRTNKPFVLKKTLVTLLVLGLVFYLLLTNGFAELLIVAFSFFIYFFRIGKKIKAKGKFPKNLIAWYKDLYKKNKWDILPVAFSCDDSNVNIVLSKAEFINRKPATEKFSVKKENLTSITFYSEDLSFRFNFKTADIFINDNPTPKTQTDSCVIIYPDENTGKEISYLLKNHGYTVTLCPEIEEKEEA